MSTALQKLQDRTTEAHKINKLFEQLHNRDKLVYIKHLCLTTRIKKAIKLFDSALALAYFNAMDELLLTDNKQQFYENIANADNQCPNPNIELNIMPNFQLKYIMLRNIYTLFDFVTSNKQEFRQKQINYLTDLANS